MIETTAPEGWPFSASWTDAELANARARTVESLVELGHAKDVKLTCDDCPCRHECDLAMDGYNTDGDCLASK